MEIVGLSHTPFDQWKCCVELIIGVDRIYMIGGSLFSIANANQFFASAAA